LGKLASHHYILMTGAQLEGIQTIAPVFELSAESL